MDRYIMLGGIELSDSLRRLLKKDKVILLGHSFGSIVGLEIHAPGKAYVEIPQAGHFAFLTRPDAVLAALVSHVAFAK
jgi:pimeloyl-ACP methyl ester carboxylesterase